MGDIVTLVLGIVALGVIILVTVKYNKKRKEEAKNPKKKKPVKTDSLF